MNAVKTGKRISWIVRYLGHVAVICLGQDVLQSYGLPLWASWIGGFVISVFVGICMTEGYVKQ